MEDDREQRVDEAMIVEGNGDRERRESWNIWIQEEEQEVEVVGWTDTGAADDGLIKLELE